LYRNTKQWPNGGGRLKAEKTRRKKTTKMKSVVSVALLTMGVVLIVSSPEMTVLLVSATSAS
jgi:hypothetical protein